MLTWNTRVRLLVFFVISVAVIGVTSIYYIRLPQLLGFQQFRVTADFSDASGIYANAIVTYRGVDVGRVHSVDLEPDGTHVVLSIDDGTHIPADSIASIHSTSAIGEQYVDLVPTSAAATPELHDGSVIERRNTRILPSTDTLLSRLDALLASVPKGTLARTVQDLSTAFDNSGPDLRSLLASASELLTTARQNAGATAGLLRGLAPFLTTQQDLASQTTSTVTDLSSFTHQLVLSNTDIVSLLRTTPSLVTQVVATERGLTPSLTSLLANLTSTGKVLQVYDPATRELLSVYPALLAGLIDFAQSSAKTGLIPLDFHLNVNLPPACIKGFIAPKQRRDPSVTTPAATPAGLYCKEAASAPPSVRGTRNLPCLNNVGVRAATPAQCLGISTAAAEKYYDRVTVPSRPAAPGTTRARAGGTSSTVARTPDQLYVASGTSPANQRENTWQDLLLRPIGR